MFYKLLLFILSVEIIIFDNYSLAQKANEEWWRNTFVYQIYPRSFKDSNGDGVGDLNGITSKLEHLADLNVSALWISPIYVSPMVDFGYDIANFTDIDPIFGSLKDFSQLTAKAKSLGIKVILDFVPNHSSDKHFWFQQSIKKVKPYDEYYIWKDGKIVNGTRYPPNNWLSLFQGSAWEWNAQRQQYYLHQFAAGQPDLNYRSINLQEEMKNVLKFWLKLGVDGFRIDTIATLVEDNRFLDEPVIPNTGLPSTDPGTLKHIYTQDQNETYDILRSWRQVLDATNGTKKMFLTEAYTSVPLTIKYYFYGSDVPFNFMFISQLNNLSNAEDFKRTIDQYLNNIPTAYSPNWVVGNHDNHRAATRFGIMRADLLTMMSGVLPGVGVIYNGDEIGMIDRPMTWEETVDPAGCNAGKTRYIYTSRDPERTPFQWDNSINSGFSTANKTWLPVHSNYKTLNLAVQKNQVTSHYSVTKKVIALKRNPVIQKGTNEIILMKGNTLGIVRRLAGYSPIVLLINFSSTGISIDAATWMNIPKKLTVYVASVGSKLEPGYQLSTNPVYLPPSASIILV